MEGGESEPEITVSLYPQFNPIKTLPSSFPDALEPSNGLRLPPSPTLISTTKGLDIDAHLTNASRIGSSSDGTGILSSYVNKAYLGSPWIARKST